MRDIKFKAKEIKSGDWIVGSNIDIREIANNGAIETICFINNVMVDPKTISEFTGKTDKNGKEIFENDIILVTNYPFKEYSQEVDKNDPFYNYRKVVYEDCEFFLEIETLNNYYDERIFEVAGNIFNNHELLKKESK